MSSLTMLSHNSFATIPSLNTNLFSSNTLTKGLLVVLGPRLSVLCLCSTASFSPYTLLLVVDRVDVLVWESFTKNLSLLFSFYLRNWRMSSLLVKVISKLPSLYFLAPLTIGYLTLIASSSRWKQYTIDNALMSSLESWICWRRASVVMKSFGLYSFCSLGSLCYL